MKKTKTFEEYLKSVLPEEQINLFFESCEKPPLKSIRFYERSSNKAHAGFKGDTYRVIDTVKWEKKGAILSEDSKPSRSLDYLKGDFYIQDIGSMFAISLLKKYVEGYSGQYSRPFNSFQSLNKKDRQKDEESYSYILDYAASPGGKTTQVADDFKQSIVVSNEIIKSRIPALLCNIKKSKLLNIIVTGEDSSFFHQHDLFFDIIVADLPCTGEGLIRKKKLLIKNWSYSTVLFNSKRQKKILYNIYDLLKEDGFFVYSTCTFSREENEENVELLESLGFELLESKRLWPHIDACSGAFTAVLKNKNKKKRISINIESDKSDSRDIKIDSDAGNSINNKTKINDIAESLDFTQNFKHNLIWHTTENCLKLLSREPYFDIEKIARSGYLYQKEDLVFLFSKPSIPKFLFDSAISFGQQMASIEKFGLIPAFESIDYFSGDYMITVDDEQICKLTKGEDLKLDENFKYYMGKFLSVLKDGSPLFLVKVSPNGVKNLTPGL